MVEASPGVFVDNPNRRVRDRLWDVLATRIGDGQAILIEPATKRAGMGSPHRGPKPLAIRRLRRTHPLRATKVQPNENRHLPRKNRIRFVSPRTCGDGPPGWSPAPRSVLSPPRLRGWSEHRGVLLDRRVVARAPAGMVLHGGHTVLTSTGRPRACGDGPSLSGLEIKDAESPRACGDGPFATLFRLGYIPSPPRLRGWSLERHHDLDSFPVAPAPAGMVRVRILRPPWPDRRPRACGDGPFVEGVKEGEFELPRACGDGPACSPSCPAALRSPPRLRGWSGPAYASRQGRRRRPRACGDGPSAPCWAATSAASPPRPRGWSMHGQPVGCAMGVAPAPAGMVRSRHRTRRLRPRRSRACGDGPELLHLCSTDTDVAPRLRGWSAGRARGVGRVHVAPAPAGMVRTGTCRPGGGRRRPCACGDGPWEEVHVAPAPAGMVRSR
ncbi:type I-E CRISPR-associated endoribonuclease Cas2 [Streptomyces mesophilus]|uniref:type I-E CRISPR-associated endoribonuclease Cas2 n=1 Tax=Streptomyces mesophilus TaxID=1775132 RepID=UPI0038B641C5